MDLPVEIEINGIAYVRKDSVPQVAEPLERLYTVQEIESMTGLNYQSIYRAIKRKKLAAVYPNGSRRGMRVPESAYREWIATA